MKVTAFKRRCRVVQEDGPNPIDVFVGKRMRARRLREGLSQIAVADRLGVSFQALHKYETADTRVSASVLYGLAQIFGVTPNYFFQGYAPGATKRSKRGRGTRANPNR